MFCLLNFSGNKTEASDKLWFISSTNATNYLHCIWRQQYTYHNDKLWNNQKIILVGFKTNMRSKICNLSKTSFHRKLLQKYVSLLMIVITMTMF